jgi:dTDP-4-dehydrorhamnose 3,5-epimerase
MTTLIIEPKVFGDHRGFFMETYQKDRYSQLGIPEFVQDNCSFSRKGILRGLHLQTPAQGKLVQVLQGEVFDVAVDMRKDSPTYLKWEGVILSESNKRQFWIPTGFAHGFYVISDSALFHYKCTEYYNPQTEVTIMWNDPKINIEWPLLGEPMVSEKDSKGVYVHDYDIRTL